MNSRQVRIITAAILAALACALFLGRNRIFSHGSMEPGISARSAGDHSDGEAPETRTDRKRERSAPKMGKELSTAELDHYLDQRGISEASLLFTLLNSGDPKYRELALRLPDSPLKFMMLSMDIHDDPKLRLEWSKKLHELDPRNRVSVARYVGQLMTAGDEAKAAEVLATAKDCDHASNGFDQLTGEFEFARKLFGDERYGPMALIVARTWPARTAHYTAENYLDTLDYSGAPDKASTESIHERTRDYLLDIGYSEEDVGEAALILTRSFLADFRDKYADPADQDLKARYSEQIKGIQAREEVLFHAGLDRYERVDKHRSAAGDRNHVMENLSKWKDRKNDRE